MRRTSILVIMCGVMSLLAAGTTLRAADQPKIPLRSLRAVQDVRLRAEPWRDAVDEAASKLSDPEQREDLINRMTAAAPGIAKMLMHDPADSAIFTIVVDQAPDDRQSLRSVIFEGLSDDAASRLIPRVIADTPATQPSASTAPADLSATSYLCYFLVDGDLRAGAMTHDQLKKSIAVALELARRGEGGPRIGELPHPTTANSPSVASAEQERARREASVAAMKDRERRNADEQAAAAPASDVNQNDRAIDTGVVDSWGVDWNRAPIVIIGPGQVAAPPRKTTPATPAQKSPDAGDVARHPPEDGRPQPMIPSRTPPNTNQPNQTPKQEVQPKKTQ